MLCICLYITLQNSQAVLEIFLVNENISVIFNINPFDVNFIKIEMHESMYVCITFL